MGEAEHSRENCPFYPACYIAGDCDRDDWKTSDCGLPKDVQQAKQKAFLEAAVLRAQRYRLGQQLAAEAHRGEHDILLKEPKP